MAKKKNGLFEWVKIILIALALAFLVRTFVVSPIVVDGPSMQPTLEDRDHMIVNKLKYRFSDMERFDIVIFHATADKDFIKRVIALPGEHVAVSDNILYIDGEPVEEPFIDKDNNWLHTEDFRLEELPGGYEKVPEDHVFVLGDNRNNSTDSRSLGVIPMDEIIGKTNVIYWPIKRMQIAN